MNPYTQKLVPEKVWVHKACGEEIESQLTYSDSEQDYYIPVCYRCQTSPDMSEMELREKEKP